MSPNPSFIFTLYHEKHLMDIHIVSLRFSPRGLTVNFEIWHGGFFNGGLLEGRSLLKSFILYMGPYSKRHFVLHIVITLLVSINGVYKWINRPIYLYIIDNFLFVINWKYSYFNNTQWYTAVCIYPRGGLIQISFNFNLYTEFD